MVATRDRVELFHGILSGIPPKKGRLETETEPAAEGNNGIIPNADYRLIWLSILVQNSGSTFCIGLSDKNKEDSVLECGYILYRQSLTRLTFFTAELHEPKRFGDPLGMRMIRKFQHAIESRDRHVQYMGTLNFIKELHWKIASFRVPFPGGLNLQPDFAATLSELLDNNHPDRA